MNLPVYVLTPTVNNEFLEQCIASVASQTYSNVKHILVIDGAHEPPIKPERFKKYINLSIVPLPWNTGGGGYLGGCIYPAFCKLLNDGFIMFLDDDNFLDPYHVESCVDLIQTNNLDWCYSLRKLTKRNGEFLCNDECNSLGSWPAYDGNYHHIDTNCYFLRHDVANVSANQLKRKAYIKGEMEGDRALSKFLMSSNFNFFCTGKYSVNYRIKGHQSYSDEDVESYYLKGNQHMRTIYHKFPWSNLSCKGLMPEHPSMEFDWSSI